MFTDLPRMVSAGRDAIENALLKVVIRPRVLNDADQAELNELYALLAKYNELMAKHERISMTTEAANDDQGATD